MSRRVAVTGLGLVTPLGMGVEANWDALVNGRSGLGPITRFETEGFSSRIAGEVRGFVPEEHMHTKLVKRTDIFIQYALAAARMAMADSGLAITEENAGRVGVTLGCGLGGLSTIERYHKELMAGGPRKVTPFFIPMLISNLAPGHISIETGAKGPNTALATACAAGSHAIGESLRYIREGRADAMITGGVESVITPLAVAGFASMKALSTRNDEPQRASRPFDRDRDGFVIAEGGGLLILEEMEAAKKRGARIYAELIGYGLNGDAHHMTAPAPEGAGAAECMRLALEDAGISPDAVDYINAHGTSTELNDLYETQAIKRVFGDHARKVAISSTKSMTGHLLGGAGGVEGAFSALAISRGVIPPTINFENPGEGCDLDYVPNVAREAKIDIAMSNSFGFGGTNACVVLKRFEG